MEFFDSEAWDYWCPHVRLPNGANTEAYPIARRSSPDARCIGTKCSQFVISHKRPEHDLRHHHDAAVVHFSDHRIRQRHAKELWPKFSIDEIRDLESLPRYSDIEKRDRDIADLVNEKAKKEHEAFLKTNPIRGCCGLAHRPTKD